VVDEVKIFVESYRETWKKTSCTLMADGWTDQKRRTLINFLVYCPKGTVFFLNSRCIRGLKDCCVVA
jgi:hypothetical protein